jgi:hypothetical protein
MFKVTLSYFHVRVINDVSGATILRYLDITRVVTTFNEIIQDQQTREY